MTALETTYSIDAKEMRFVHIRAVLVAQNRFEGSIDLRRLPSSLVQLNLSENNFSGEICPVKSDRDKLPESLHKLDVHLNRLSGSLDLRGLSKGLEQLELSSNHFRGSLDLEPLRETTTEVNLACNAFTGSVSLPRKHIHVRMNPMLIADEDYH